jgi:outer membrane lipoprotein-sorting protein
MLIFGGAILAAVAIVSCSGVPSSPAGVAKKMLRAHGGSEKIARLQSYVGKGFIKDLNSEVVARSFAYDVYRKGRLFKQKIMSAPGGKLSSVIVMYFDGATSRRWESGGRTVTVPTMDLGVLKYRFPEVIQWAQGADRKGERLSVEKGENVVRLRYEEGDDVVTLAIDRKNWLLAGVEITSLKDTSFAFSEAYDHYTDIEGIPFPQEFKGTYKGKVYYDYMLSKIELRSDLPDSLFRVTAEDSAGIARPAVREVPAR